MFGGLHGNKAHVPGHASLHVALRMHMLGHASLRVALRLHAPGHASLRAVCSTGMRPTPACMAATLLVRLPTHGPRAQHEAASRCTTHAALVCKATGTKRSPVSNPKHAKSRSLASMLALFDGRCRWDLCTYIRTRGAACATLSRPLAAWAHRSLWMGAEVPGDTPHAAPCARPQT